MEQPDPLEGPTTVPSSEDDVKAAYARLQSLVSLSAESVLSSNLLPEFSTLVTRRMRSSVLSAEQKTCLGVFSDPRLYCKKVSRAQSRLLEIEEALRQTAEERKVQM